MQRSLLKSCFHIKSSNIKMNPFTLLFYRKTPMSLHVGNILAIGYYARDGVAERRITLKCKLFSLRGQGTGRTGRTVSIIPSSAPIEERIIRQVRIRSPDCCPRHRLKSRVKVWFTKVNVQDTPRQSGRLSVLCWQFSTPHQARWADTGNRVSRKFVVIVPRYIPHEPSSHTRRAR